jgi:hypothetical protein
VLELNAMPTTMKFAVKTEQLVKKWSVKPRQRLQIQKVSFAWVVHVQELTLALAADSTVVLLPSDGIPVAPPPV